MINDNQKISNVLKKIFNLNFLLIFVLFCLALPAFVFAQVDLDQAQEIASGAGLGTADSQIVIGQIIKIALGFLGLIGLVIVIIAGFKWMTSGGNEEKVKSAKKMLLAGAAGMVVILFSYIIVNFIINKVQEGTGAVGGGGNTTENQSCDDEGACHGCNYICSGGEVVYSETCDCSGEQRLRVDSYSPKGNNVKLCQKVQIEFSENVKSSTVNVNNIKIYKCSAPENCSNDITSQGTLNHSNNIVQFSLDSYEENTEYKVFVDKNGIEGESGKKLSQDFSWNFNTGSEDDDVPPTVIKVFPEGNDVCLKSHISAEFSEEMDKISLLRTDSFELFKNVNTQTDFTFRHSVNGNKLILKPNKNFDVNTKYLPLLDGSKIMDSCGNKLDGNKDGTRQESPVDNYPPNGPADLWSFTSGLNDKCEPTITGISPDEAYYDGEKITITGQYLSDAVVVFDNQITVDEQTEVCIAEGADKWPSRVCKSGVWDSDSISLYIPAQGSDLNGVRNGNIKVQTTEGIASANFDLKSPRIENVSPENGGKGQFVTIKGSGFGASKGSSRVVLRPMSSTDIDGDLELSCGNESWHDTYIIVTVPENINIGDYYFQVVKKGAFAGEKWSNIYAFEVEDSLPGPGLCSVDHDTVKYNENFVASGVRLGDDSYDDNGNERNVLLGSYYNAVTSTVITWSNPDNGQDTKVTVQTPNLQKGEVGVRVVTQKNGVTKFSNSISIMIAEDPVNQFKITYISPASSTVGSYITIYGSGFGNTKGASSTVRFKNGANDIWFDGDFQFPSVCSTNYWRDDRIIVKVPNSFNLTGDLNSQVKVIKNIDSPNQQETNPAAFIVREGNPAPSICSIDPDKGLEGDSIMIYGEYFNNLDQARFSYNQDNDDVSMSGTSGNSISVTVPETKTGLLALHSSDAGYGNTVNFEYGENGSIPPSQTNWDFYGWHFETCDNCKIPRVFTSPCSEGLASPSPRSGSKDVPIDARIFFAFEYPGGNAANIKTSTLILNNFELLNCGNGENPICSDTLQGFTITNFNQSSIEFSSNINFTAGNWYKFRIKPNSIYDQDNMLLSSSNNEIFFKINSDGGKCVPDTMRINPWKKIVSYEPSKKIGYYDSLIDSDGCYVCSNKGYDYTWEEESSGNLISLINLGSRATATLNNYLRTGTVIIKSEASSSTLNVNLSASSTLQINLGCSIFNSEPDPAQKQYKCVDDNGEFHPDLTCCWNSAQATCVDDGNPVCLEPYLKLASCKKSNNAIVQLASPSPVNYSMNAPIDAIIHAQFGGYGGESFKMNTATYDGGMQIFSCGNSTSTCNVLSTNMNVSNDLSGDSFVSYSHVDAFIPNTWYKIRLLGSIEDMLGNNLQQPAEWYFKTTSNACATTQLSILPSSVVLPVSAEKRLVAICSDKNCNVCASGGYQYSWSSANPTIASILESITNISTTTANAVGSTTIKVINHDLGILNNRIVNVVANCGRFTESSTCNNDSNCCWNGSKCSSNTASCVSQCSSLTTSGESVCESTVDSPVCCWSGTSCLNGTTNPKCIAQDNCSKNTNEQNCSNASCCWANNNCTTNMSLCNHGNFTMTSHYPTGNSCINPMIQAEFNAIINYNSINANNIILEDVGAIGATEENIILVPTQFYAYSKGTNQGVINMELLSPLKKNNKYRVRFLGSIRSVDGKTLNCADQNASESSEVLVEYVNKLKEIFEKNIDILNGLIESQPGEEYESILSEILEKNISVYDEIRGVNLEEIFDFFNDNQSRFVDMINDCAEKRNQLLEMGYEVPEELYIDEEVIATMDAISSINQQHGQSIHQECAWNFQTNSNPCELSYIEIVDPTGHYYEYNQKDFEKEFRVEAQDAYGNPISRIENFYSWDWQWTSGDNSLVGIVGSSITSSTIFKSQNKNGNTMATIIAKKKNPPVGFNDQDIKDEAEINLFMCNAIWEFSDFGFKLRYCRDGGLPELKGVNDKGEVIVPINPIDSENGLVHELLFRYQDPPVSKLQNSKFNLVQSILENAFNGFVARVFAQTAVYQEDIIGIRIYQNKKHLSPRDWYKSTNSFDFKGNPQSKRIDRYDGLSDGRTVYVNAGRLFTWDVPNVGQSGKISTNIYLISKNQNSSPITNNIYNQLVDNWQFNTGNDPEVKQKIIQDVKRWQDLRSMENGLENYANTNKYCASIVSDSSVANCQGDYFNGDCYNISNTKCSNDGNCIANQMQCVKTYPELTSGTYIRGITNSIWGSWSNNLGTTLKTSLPLDPENHFVDCQATSFNFDTNTCFDSNNKLFNCMPGSKLYYYKASTYNNIRAKKALGYKLYALLHYSNINDWFGDDLGDSINITNQDVCNGYFLGDIVED